MRHTLLAMALMATLGCFAQNAADRLVLRFDFTQTSGTTVTDAVAGVAARTQGAAKVVDMGSYRVLDLGNASGYLDMTTAAGSVLAATGNYTLSMFYRVDASASLSGNGYFLWAFSTSAACTQTAGAYTGYRLNAQRIASSTTGWGSEVGAEMGAASAQGRWVHVAYTQTATTGRLYIDGTQVKAVSGMPTNATLFGTTAPTCCWIGRAPFSGDAYLRGTLVADVRLYDSALTAAEVAEIAGGTVDLDDAYTHGTAGDATALRTAISTARPLLSDAACLAAARQELQDMIERAEIVAAGTFSQAYIDALTAQLTSLTARVRSTAGATLPQSVVTAYDSDRGFRHPGGLHTEADFERVRQQLAAGNATVTAAYDVLRRAEYAQSTTATWPVETIVRGGGSGENYINAARGATIAYQNALRWRIEGNTSCARHAVDVLMQWARTTNYIGGNSNYALAAGLYGYQFAQAAELMRDYDGWAEADFDEFCQWMLRVWYPTAIGFLRGRNGTWENAGKWWQAPGHYWSNWGLCNALCVTLIGILCDDVAIYNQGLSYYKYDQVGTFRDPRTADPILNDGLTEFLGNLVVTTYPWERETAAYGLVGQMNESGRDTGHSAMALGLAVDLAKVGWSQGDDLFAYMDHRLAAGIEYVAAQTQSYTDLPWVNYHYGEAGFYYTDSRSWLMTGPAIGAQTRPYWGTVIGIYEGVKGVEMPFSEVSYAGMGIDGGGLGGTSGGYDHLGYSVLMNTREPQLCPAAQVPTELTPAMEYSGTLTANLIPSLDQERTRGMVSGKVVRHNELGGLVNTFQVNNTTCVPRGQTLRLMPQLPDGEEDTGLWLWDTGQTTRELTVTTDRSRIYRVAYTNARGIRSELSFAIAVAGDNQPARLTPYIAAGGATTSGTDVSVLYGEAVELRGVPTCGWGSYCWSTGQTTEAITTTPALEDRDYTLYYTNQSATVSAVTFHVAVELVRPWVTNAAGTLDCADVVAEEDESVTLGVEIPDVVAAADVVWSNGARGRSITVGPVQQTATYTASFTLNGHTVEQTFHVYLHQTQPAIEPGTYLLRHNDSNTFLTAHGKNQLTTFEPLADDAEDQQWHVTTRNNRAYAIISLPDSLGLSTAAKPITSQLYSFYFEAAAGTDLLAMHTGTTAATTKYWAVDADGNVQTAAAATLQSFPFSLVPVSEYVGISRIHAATAAAGRQAPLFDLSGRRMPEGQTLPQGIYVAHGRKVVVR